MSKDQSTTRRGLLGAIPAIAALAALPSLAAPAAAQPSAKTSDLESLRGFLRFYNGGDGEKALDHAIAANMQFEDLTLISFWRIAEPVPGMLPILMFKAGNDRIRAFRPRGEDQ